MIRTYVDSGVLIAASRFNGAGGATALGLITDPDRAFVCSIFVRLEVLPKAVYHRRRDEIAFYEAFFARVVAWADPNGEMVELAEREAAGHGLNALDALHVAAAGLLGAAEMVTTEGLRKPIPRTTGVRVVGL